MKRTTIWRTVPVLLLLCLLMQMLPFSAFAALPQRTEKVVGVTVQQNGKAKVDLSNLAEGYLSVAYLGGQDVRIKVRIQKAGGIEYTYDLNSKGVEEVFPITDGDGSYTITVFENISGTKYAQAFSCAAQVKLRNPYLPYLYPNQYVNYTTETRVVLHANEVCAAIADPLEKVAAVYEWVTATFTYDTQLAQTVQSGYLPVLDAIYEKKSGICFDYASVMTAMLRSQGIPSKLVIGYAGDAYHAWINVYTEQTGWIEGMIQFDGVNWSLMDPTFAASLGATSTQLAEYIGDGSNYLSKYAY